jgi:excisionase family DNA binding protein
MEVMTDKLISVKQVAETLGRSERQIWRMVQDGELPCAVRMGHSSRWFWSDIEGYLQKLKEQRNT